MSLSLIEVDSGGSIRSGIQGSVSRGFSSYIENATINTVGNSKLARFSLATEYAYKSQDGTCVIDTTWFNCRVWEGSGIGNIDAIVRGAKVHLTGRLKYSRYIDAQGNDRVMYEVIVRELRIMEE